MNKITVLTLIDRIACFYSLYPFLVFGGRGRFDFTSSPEYCLNRDTNEILIMVRQFIKPDMVDEDLLRKLRGKYRVIAYFHDDAGGGIPRLEVLPHVDLFYSKALFKDRSLYKQRLYGKELYSDYYHKKYGVTDSNPRERAVVSDDALLNKLRLSWNIGVGDYPREKLRQRAGTAAAKIFGPRAARTLYSRKKPPQDPAAKNTGKYPVHARIGLTGRPSISYQRALILERIGKDPRFLVGEVSQKQYNRELGQSKIVLSPFGWGELCLRDFEALRAGALLMKPGMDHLETWPDIFWPGETYVPFSWDADDMMGKVEEYLGDEKIRLTVVRAAWERYRAQLAGLEERFESIIKEISQ
jgi:hypothetical protein